MDELRRLLDRNVASQERGEDVLTVQELDNVIENRRAKMEALRLQREALMLDAPQMLWILVSSSETQLHQLWMQVQQLVTHFWFLSFLARSAKLPTGLYIWLALISFFFRFLFLLLF